ncbi:Rdx family-domain-containing protein [Aspergillus pseudotamarii]|uniref:Rdx family-domain-containing protein n=1 Tax=Aspergillus pseudotamarii TaxID=132259 RepID=A0A5N6SIS6_ASPPS|nr:Rdx family-domain-containing protein [Aspergillus pseudotamarii]KAE8134586.1 Rdx family-domain-containing protein [Aspergillus pseudotamarii]
MTTPEPQKKTSVATEKVHLPRITIKYCTQCKWMLRAAYFAQELLSTFSTDLGEVALIPATGGIFTVTIYHSSSEDVETQETILWDRKTNGGFPEVKVLKSLVRNVIDPSRDLGHTDRALRAANVPVKEGGVAGVGSSEGQGSEKVDKGEKECQDCR